MRRQKVQGKRVRRARDEGYLALSGVPCLLARSRSVGMEVRDRELAPITCSGFVILKDCFRVNSHGGDACEHIGDVNGLVSRDRPGVIVVQRTRIELKGLVWLHIGDGNAADIIRQDDRNYNAGLRSIVGWVQANTDEP